MEYFSKDVEHILMSLLRNTPCLMEPGYSVEKKIQIKFVR